MGVKKQVRTIEDFEQMREELRESVVTLDGAIRTLKDCNHVSEVHVFSSEVMHKYWPKVMQFIGKLSWEIRDQERDAKRLMDEQPKSKNRRK